MTSVVHRLDEIGGILSEILDAPLPTLPISDPLTTAARAYLATTGEKRTPTAPALLAANADTQITYGRLGHINLNPNEQLSVEAVLAAYEFAEDSRAVNCSLESVAQLWTRLVNASADDGRRRALGAHATPPSRVFLLEGDRGCGKTFFLNYMLAAAYTGLLSTPPLRKEVLPAESDDAPNVVIWIRLDVSRDVGDKFDLQARLKTKLAKLLFRYFGTGGHTDSLSTRNARIDVQTELLASIRAEDLASEADLVHEVDALKLRFGRRMTQQEEAGFVLTEHAVSAPMQELCLGVAIRNGYKLVAVLDGLDRLEATPRWQAQFDDCARQIREFSVAADFPFSVLAVCRSGAVASVLHTANPHNIPDEHIYRVAAPSLRRIVDKRFRVLRKDVHQAALDHRLPHFGEREFERWSRDFDDFEEQVHREVLDDIERLFGTEPNRRVQMQSLQRAYLGHIRGRKGSYRLIESLTLSGRVLPPDYFAYDVEADGKTWHKNRIDTVPIDHRFMPLLFSQPSAAPQNPSPIGNGLNRFRGALLKIRVIQAMLAIADSRDAHTDGVRAKDVQRTLEPLGYSSLAVSMAIHELAEFSVIGLSGGANDFSTSEGRLRLIPLPRALTLLSFAVSEISYLNLAAMQLTAPLSWLEGTTPFVCALTARSHLSARSADDWSFAREWIAAKILNSVSIVRLSRTILEEETRVLANDSSSLPERDATALRAMQHHDSFGMFALLHAMESAVRSQPEGALKGLAELGEGCGHNDPTGIELISRRLNSYRDRWAKT